jgi:D-alanyl-D-alanine carboxypeptidase
MKHNKILIVTILFLSVLSAISCRKYEPFDRQSRVLTEEIIAQLEDSADRVFNEISTPGLIALISVEGEHDYLIKRGVSNITTGEPMDERNWFRIASNTKTFTGTAVLILVDEGLINLDASISSYLPEFNIPAGDQITVRMLGNMTSGLYNYSDDPGLWEYFINSNFIMTFPPDSLLAMAFRHPAKFKPGTSYEYCNTDIVLLGLLIEKVTGKPVSQVIKDKVTDPMNLDNTYWGGPYFKYTPYSHGYNSDLGSLTDATNWNPSWGYSAGAMVSNIHDMKIWAKAVAEGRLLSDRMAEVMFKWGTDGYGFCIEKLDYKNDRWIGHPGTIPGYNSQVFYNLQKKITLVIYSNTDVGLPAQAFLISCIKILSE